jgi:thiosulfate dehydrogenase [quinone] large subunit
MIYHSLQVERSEMENPIILQKLCTNSRLAWIWLPLRLYLGWVWLSAGWERIGDAAWMTTGEAVRRFWSDAVATSCGGDGYTTTVGWYRAFIRLLLDGGHYTWFGRLIVFAAMAIGVLLILGAFTGIVAALAAFMNWNFIMAGTASANGLLLILALLLVIGWRVAGHIGLDYWLLPLLGTPWSRRKETST